ncbi:MAG: hypothetical protein WC805_01740 [Patescibacteria group bacterium]|jgi:hypothetical protein
MYTCFTGPITPDSKPVSFNFYRFEKGTEVWTFAFLANSGAVHLAARIKAEELAEQYSLPIIVRNSMDDKLVMKPVLPKNTPGLEDNPEWPKLPVFKEESSE